MKKTRVSVIMPAFNSEKYIGEAIESILNQTFSDFEFVIINDGSTDNTAKIIKQYAKKDKRIKFIDNKKNSGFIASLNQCFDVASGEYIAKMDSDDISLPTRLEKQVEYLDKNPNCGLVGCGYRAFDKLSFDVIHPEKIGVIDLIKTCATTIFMCRKSILDKFNLRFNPDFYCAEDYDFYSRFIRYADIHNLQEILYLYRWHGENVSITKSEIQQKNSEIVRKNLLNLLSGSSEIQAGVMELIDDKPEKIGILLPKWMGRICCLFIFNRERRHKFRDNYVKE